MVQSASSFSPVCISTLFLSVFFICHIPESCAKSIAHRRIELKISFYEVQGAGAKDKEHKQAACEKSSYGCRLKFSFHRCPDDNEQSANCGNAFIEHATSTGCYSCEQDLGYCQNTTKAEHCLLLANIDGHGKSYKLTVSEPSASGVDILASVSSVPVGQGQYLIEAPCHNQTECGKVMITLLQNSTPIEDTYDQTGLKP